MQVAKQADLMIVVGGRHSANTNRLAQICCEAGARTAHLETADELCPKWLEGVRRVGITAGASTPPEAVEAVRARLLEIAAQRAT